LEQGKVEMNFCVGVSLFIAPVFAASYIWQMTEQQMNSSLRRRIMIEDAKSIAVKFHGELSDLEEQNTYTMH